MKRRPDLEIQRKLLAEMRTADFDYELPPELIAQQPARERDGSRLLVLRRESGQLLHKRFRDLPEYLRSGDLLVVNDSRVIPARLRGVNATTGGKFEILLLEETARNEWWAMLRPGKSARVGTWIEILRPDKRASGIHASVVETNAEGHRRLRFGGFEGHGADAGHATPLPSRSGGHENRPPRAEISSFLDELGEVPLPPYIERNASGSSERDRERYQTVYARVAGSVAAPTAGLHFTEPLMARIRSLGVEMAFLTLHVGLATFAPVKTETISAHPMHEERYELSEETAEKIRVARRAGGRVIAVGTTTVRVLESLAAGRGPFPCPASGRTRMFIYPPFEFKAVDGLITNFHLPRSTLLMLVSAFAAPKGLRGREMVLAAYREAVRQQYRFFSYGDAMLIL